MTYDVWRPGTSAPKVTCVTINDGEHFLVDVDVLRLSHSFDAVYQSLDLDEDADFPQIYPVKDVSAHVFRKVIDWCEKHKGQPDPIVHHDPITRERKWFKLTKYEKKFLDVPVEELEEIIMAANTLDIKSLYLYGCQTMAAHIKGKSPEEIRELFGMEDDLTEEEKREIRRSQLRRDMPRATRSHKMFKPIAFGKIEP
ncbi:SKR-1 protein [Aphelenchoides avenae]|nr:SKR-1 protein [Aphelenchus avenae]